MRVVTVIAGGTGSVKLVRGLAKIADAAGGDLRVIVNVGDNIWLHGLYVCPDVDTIVYGLAGMLDKKRGWGVAGDTFAFLDQLKKLDRSRSWFGLGDRDLATHVIRTTMMKDDGKSLSEVTEFFADRLGIRAKIIPATDDEVATMIRTGTSPAAEKKEGEDGEIHLQEFWVKRRGMPRVAGVRYAGAETARENPAAVEAIRESDTIIIAPGNPVSSIGPTLAIAGIRAELASTRDRVVAVSPIIGARALSGPAAKYMKAVGVTSSPEGVASFYREVAGALVISPSDYHNFAGKIERKHNIKVYKTDITMADRRDEVRLARHLLKLGKKS
ncbi:MAG: 2-phospho-L-lactate transferase [Nitrososphaera sp.]